MSTHQLTTFLLGGWVRFTNRYTDSQLILLPGSCCVRGSHPPRRLFRTIRPLHDALREGHPPNARVRFGPADIDDLEECTRNASFLIPSPLSLLTMLIQDNLVASKCHELHGCLSRRRWDLGFRA